MTIDQAITMRQMFNDFMVNFKNEFGGNIPKDQAAAIAKLQDAFERDFANMMKLDSEIDDAILQQVKRNMQPLLSSLQTPLKIMKAV